MKTAELEGAALDAAVAMVEGKTFERATARTAFGCDVGAPIIGFERDGPIVFRPSTDWSIGGPIIERERIAVYPGAPDADAWFADMPGVWPLFKHKGCTPLIAAMRAFIASKLGEEFELP